MKIKNILIIFLMSLTVITGSLFTSVSATESTAATVDGASYYKSENINTTSLGFGVTHIRDYGFSKVSKYVVASSGNAGSSGSNGTIELDRYYSQRINLLEIAPTGETKIVPGATIKGGAWSLTTVSEMAQNYEEENPGWKVVAAVNGDFFDIGGANNYPYTPLGVMIADGEVYKADTANTWNVLAFDNSETGITMNYYTGSQTNALLSSNYILSVYNANEEIIKKIEINKVNSTPGSGEISLYFSTYTNRHRVENPITVENAYIVGSCLDSTVPSASSFYGKGLISSFGTASLSINQFGIVSNNLEINELLAEGVKIRVQRELTGAMANIDSAIGCRCPVIENGIENTTSNVDDYGTTRLPRTVIGKKADGTIAMVVVDGRQAKTGYYGATGIELAAICKYYGITDAYQFDGGGSTTMVIYDGSGFSFMNSPSDSSGLTARSDSNCVLVVTKVSTYEVSFDVTDNTSIASFVAVEEIEKYKDLYIEFEGTKKQIVDNKVTITELSAYKTYSFKLYSMLNGEFVDLHTTYSFTTAKVTPLLTVVYYNLNINDDKKEYTLALQFTGSESIVSTAVIIDGITYKCTKNTVVLPGSVKNLLADDTYTIQIVYDVLNGKGEVVENLDSFKLTIGNGTLVLDAISEEIQYSLLDILKK